MGFRIKHGGIDSIIRLAQIAGAAQDQRRQQAIAVDIAKSLYAEQSRMAVAKFQADAQQEAMKQRYAWEFQKIQMSQENDFLMTEQLRMQEKQDEYNKQSLKEQEFETTMKAIDDADWITDKQKEQFKINAEAKHRMGPGAPQIREQKGMTPMDMMKLQKSAEDSRRDLERDLKHHQEVIDSFSETEGDFYPVWGIRGKGMARKNKEGEWVLASAQDKMALGYSERRIQEILKELGEGSGDPWDVGGVDPNRKRTSYEEMGPPEPFESQFSERSKPTGRIQEDYPYRAWL
ncbi:hypothetical protein LCGC14_0475060 [marine sediment metagenome]|uniref:Uncharacterized protein n=1 Tax=marine sediment metagenome TaxID=412755 RepID=A0A0F9VJL3_9ZZZZ